MALRTEMNLCKDDRCEDYICKVGYADDRSSATNPGSFTGTEGNVCEGKMQNIQFVSKWCSRTCNKIECDQCNVIHLSKDIDECIIGKEYHDRDASDYASGKAPEYKCISDVKGSTDRNSVRLTV